MKQNKERIGNLRFAISNLQEEKGLKFSDIEQELRFKSRDIEYFIKAEWDKVSKSFSPYALCIHLNIKIEDIHSGYFRDFGEIKKYEDYILKFHINEGGDTNGC